MLGGEMTDYAGRVVAKGNGRWIMGATSSNGRCRDADVTGITMFPLDCDGRGDWTPVRAALDEARIAYVAQHSSSHTPEILARHLTPPLSRPWTGPKSHWRCIWRWVVGFFAGVAQLRVDFEAESPSYGFDHTTDRLGQPIFLAAKRHRSQETPETIVADGLALDLEELPHAQRVRSLVARATSNVRADDGRRGADPSRAGLAGDGVRRGRHARNEADRAAVVERHASRLCRRMSTRAHAHDGATIRRFDNRRRPGPGADPGLLHLPAPLRQDEGRRRPQARCPRRRCSGPRSGGRKQSREHPRRPRTAPTSAPTRATRSAWSHAMATRSATAAPGSPGSRGTVDGGGSTTTSTSVMSPSSRPAQSTTRLRSATISRSERRSPCGRTRASPASCARPWSRARSEPSIAVDHKSLDGDAMLFNCENGTIDLRTGALREHRRGDLITKLAPIKYDSKAECPRFDQFMAEIMGGDLEPVASTVTSATA